ncbi:MAG: ORF6N domain-containing protein [Ruminococcus sp.]|nr:ORF6N domain-containing protein [Ruminococcus sp.]
MTELKLTPIENKGKRVLTAAQLAEAYGTDNKIISNNFNRNKDRYIEGVHFYRLTGDELREFKTNQCTLSLDRKRRIKKIKNHKLLSFN